MTGKRTKWYAAALAKYVIVEARDVDDAKATAIPQLAELLGVNPQDVQLRTCRPATQDEIDIQDFFDSV